MMEVYETFSIALEESLGVVCSGVSIFRGDGLTEGEVCGSNG